MTTREFLRARVIRLYRISLPFVIVILAISLWGRRSLLLIGFVLAVIIAYLTAYVMYVRRTQCLRCHAALGNAALNWGSKKQPTASCPNCGLSIDEQVGVS
jgi:nitrate/TMAO reductase-like tetraheme cytochrome c subunit